MTKPILRLFAAFALAAALDPGTCQALDLMDSYQQAQSYDPSMLAADQAQLAGREKAVQGAALLKPQLTLSAGVSHVDSQFETDLPPVFADLIKERSSGTVHQVSLQMTQPIYNMRALADSRQMREQSGLADVRHRDAQQDLVQRVGEAYFNLLLAQDNLRVSEAEEAAVGAQRERAQARFELGRGRITEVQEAQACYDAVQARQVSALATLELRRAQYAALTGVEPQQVAPLSERFVAAPPVPDKLLDWQVKGLARNTRVMTREGELAIAEAEIAKYKLSGRPTVELVASYSSRGQNGSLSPTEAPNDSHTSTIGVQLRIPLYSGGALQSQQRESIAKRGEAEQRLSATRRDTRLQVQDAFLSVRSGVARIAALDQSVRSAQTALDATLLGRDVGTRTELDVLDAQQHLYSVQRDLAQARTDYLLGRLRLASAAGELGQGTLQELNAYLAR